MALVQEAESATSEDASSRSLVSAHTLVTTLLCVLFAIMYLDRVNISAAAASVKAHFALTNTEMGLTFSAFSWAYLASVLVGGWGARKYGARSTLVVSVIVASLGTIATGLAGCLVPPSIARLIVGLREDRSRTSQGPQRLASEPRGKDSSFGTYEADVSSHDRDVCIWMDVLGVRILASSLLCEPARHRSQKFRAAHQRPLLRRVDRQHRRRRCFGPHPEKNGSQPVRALQRDLGVLARCGRLHHADDVSRRSSRRRAPARRRDVFSGTDDRADVRNPNGHFEGIRRTW